MPYNPDPRIHLGLIYEEAGQFHNVLEQFDQALEFAPDLADVLQAGETRTKHTTGHWAVTDHCSSRNG